jgi:hypothetical protein
VIGIASDGKCDCPPGQCAKFVEPDTECIGRLDGDVRTAPCPKCCTGTGETWHQDGKCLRCASEAKP